MKIVFVSDAIYPYNKGGKEKRLFEMSKRLASLGHDVHIYTMHWWEGPDKFHIEHGVRLHAISKRYEMYAGDRRSIKEGVMFGLACFKLLRVQFDVLDVDHMPFFPIFSAWAVCRLRNKKLYGTWHEALSRQDWIDYMGAMGNIAFLIERISTRLPYHITAASAQTYKLLGEYHYRTRNVSMVTSGIATDELKKVEPAPLDCDVLYVGRLVKDKGVDKLIRAVGIIAKKKRNIRCIIIGHGVEKRHLQGLTRRLNLQDNISFLDQLPEAKDVYAYMKKTKVFCLPSVREGFGIVALEALGCNTPVVTVDAISNAARHLIEDGQTGSIVPLDIQAIADALEGWLDMGRKPNIAKRVAHYDWSRLALQQAEVYAL